MKLPAQAVWGEIGTARLLAQSPIAPVKLLERADIGCVLVASAVEASAVTGPLGASAGCAFPLMADAGVSTDFPRALWLNPRTWILQCDVEQEGSLVARLNESFADRRVHATRFSDALCWFEWTGPTTFDLLRRGGFISLDREEFPVGRCKRTLIAAVAVFIVRDREECMLLGVERSRARYFVEWVIRACDLTRVTPSA